MHTDHASNHVCARPVWRTGYTDVLVYKDGVYGWRLDEDVRPYPSYDVDEPVPEPEVDFKVETIDEDAAVAELRVLGVL
jgi:hypothetical protein